MKNLIKLEEVTMFGFSIVLFNLTDFTWWWFALLILAPDIGMLGYLAGNKIGAFTYNLFHHKAVAIIILCLGWHGSIEWLELAGIILFGHSSLDGIFGYGHKYVDSFQHTNLGWRHSDSQPILKKPGWEFRQLVFRGLLNKIKRLPARGYKLWRV